MESTAFGAAYAAGMAVGVWDQGHSLATEEVTTFEATTTAEGVLKYLATQLLSQWHSQRKTMRIKNCGCCALRVVRWELRVVAIVT